MVKQPRLVSGFSLLCIWMALFSCTPKPVELKEDFSFVSGMKPYPEGRGMETALGSILDLANQDRIEKGADSVLAFQQEDPGNKMPDFQDLAFLPVSNAAHLKELSRTGFGTAAHSDYESRIDQIDFNKNFVLITAFPEPKIDLQDPSAYSVVFDKLMDKGVKDKTRKLVLDCSRLGEVAPLAVLGSKWKNKVYILDKKECGRLEVELYDATYSFPLK